MPNYCGSRIELEGKLHECELEIHHQGGHRDRAGRMWIGDWHTSERTDELVELRAEVERLTAERDWYRSVVQAGRVLHAGALASLSAAEPFVKHVASASHEVHRGSLRYAMNPISPERREIARQVIADMMRKLTLGGDHG